MGKISFLFAVSLSMSMIFTYGSDPSSGTNVCFRGECPHDTTDPSSLLQNKLQMSLTSDKKGDKQGDLDIMGTEDQWDETEDVEDEDESIPELFEEKEEEEDPNGPPWQPDSQPGGLVTRDFQDFHKEMTILSVIANYLDYPAFLNNETVLLDQLFGANGLSSMLDRISNGRLSLKRSNVKIVTVTVPKLYADYEDCSKGQYRVDVKRAVLSQHPDVNLVDYTYREFFIPFDYKLGLPGMSKCGFAGNHQGSCHPSMIPVNGRREFPQMDECNVLYRTDNEHAMGGRHHPHVRTHEILHTFGLWHGYGEKVTEQMMNSTDSTVPPPPGVVAPTRRRGNPSKRGSLACRRRSNTEADSNGWRCGLYHTGKWEQLNHRTTDMGNRLERPDITAAERWQVGFLLSGSREVIEWSIRDADRTVKVQSLEKKPGVPGADAVAVRFRCPACKAKRENNGEDDGGYVWVDFHGDDTDENDYGCVYSKIDCLPVVKSRIMVHYFPSFGHGRRRSMKNLGTAQGRGPEIWASLEIGQSYSDISEPCIQIQFVNIVDGIATVSLKYSCSQTSVATGDSWVDTSANPAPTPAPTQTSPWVKGGNGETCNQVCAHTQRVCDSSQQSGLTTYAKVRDAFAEAGYTCKGAHGARNYAGSPFSTGRSDDCAPFSTGTSSCTANNQRRHAPLCYCKAATPAPTPAPIPASTPAPTPAPTPATTTPSACSSATTFEACSSATCAGTHMWKEFKCTRVECTEPTTKGYDYSGAIGVLTPVHFGVKGVTCSPGYTGAAVVASCGGPHLSYRVSGCQKSCSVSEECPDGYHCNGGVCVETAPPLVDLGSSGCTSKRPCARCEGDCDTDADCATGLKCFQRGGYTFVPGCKVGGSGDTESLDYCYEG